MERLQRIMIGNGLLVVLASMLAGFMLMFGLLGGVRNLARQHPLDTHLWND